MDAFRCHLETHQHSAPVKMQLTVYFWFPLSFCNIEVQHRKSKGRSLSRVTSCGFTVTDKCHSLLPSVYKYFVNDRSIFPEDFLFFLISSKTTLLKRYSTIIIQYCFLSFCEHQDSYTAFPFI